MLIGALPLRSIEKAARTHGLIMEIQILLHISNHSPFTTKTVKIKLQLTLPFSYLKKKRILLLHISTFMLHPFIYFGHNMLYSFMCEREVPGHKRATIIEMRKWDKPLSLSLSFSIMALYCMVFACRERGPLYLFILFPFPYLQNRSFFLCSGPGQHSSLCLALPYAPIPSSFICHVVII